VTPAQADPGTDGLVGRVADLCWRAVDRLPADAVPAVRAAARGLFQPLRLAFVGRVSSGKSTLVNAFLGYPVAATDEGECTKKVTWLSFGAANGAWARTYDGGRVPFAFAEDRSLPEKLVSVEARMVESIEVQLSLERLRGTTLIDTPGLNSLDEDNSLQTVRFLGIDEGSRAAARTADAILFVLNSQVHEDEEAVLSQFRSTSFGLHAEPANALGVLAKADEVTMDAAGAWREAARLAANHSRRLSRSVAKVVPVIGLLAETAACNFSEPDAAAVRSLAALDDNARDDALMEIESFSEWTGDSEPRRWEGLWKRLRRVGLTALLELGPQASAPAMVRTLRQCSGVDALEQEVDRRFHSRSHALKADRALATLRQSVSGSAVDVATRRLVNRAIDDLSIDPAMHPLEELRAMSVIASGRAGFTDQDAEDALGVLGYPDPLHRMEVIGATGEGGAAAAAAEISRWLMLSNTVLSVPGRSAARVVARSVELCVERMQGES